jgi:hypothetical protein
LIKFLYRRYLIHFLLLMFLHQRFLGTVLVPIWLDLFWFLFLFNCFILNNIRCQFFSQWATLSLTNYFWKAFPGTNYLVSRCSRTWVTCYTIAAASNSFKTLRYLFHSKTPFSNLTLYVVKFSRFYVGNCPARVP